MKNIYHQIAITAFSLSVLKAQDSSLLPSFGFSEQTTGLLAGRLVGDTAMDRAWSSAILYKNDFNPILQEFALQGRTHLQGADGHSKGNRKTQGHFEAADRNSPSRDESFLGDDVEIRRARLGFKSKWFNNYKFDGMINLDTNFQPSLYGSLYDLYVSYAPSDTFNLSAGKTKVKFSREQETSSNNILTFERTLLANALFPGELTGVWANGKGIQGGWLYELGYYGNERHKEFSDLDGGRIILAKVGYDYSAQSGLESAVASVHFMHNTEPSYRGNLDTSPSYTESYAITNEITQGRFGLVTEALFGNGNGKQSDVQGITILPSYFIAPGLQLITRFQYAASDDKDDLTLPGRYENLSTTGLSTAQRTGDKYLSSYAGLNYYINGHKLKLMTGIEYSSMEGTGTRPDFDGYTWMNGLRFSF